MKLSFLLPMLPAFSFALQLVPIPSPLDAGGRKLPLEDGTSFGNGKWVVEDTSGLDWYTLDAGTNWSRVPAPRGGSGLENGIFGSAILDSTERSYWTPESGWKAMVFRGRTPTGNMTYIGSDGIRGFSAGDGSSQEIYSSSDDLRSWDFQFALDESDPGFDSWAIFRQAGKFWFGNTDSNSLFGTSNGVSWDKIPLPEDFGFVHTYETTDPSVFTLVGFDAATQGFTDLRTSRDRGATWTKIDLEDPATHSHPIAEGVWLSETYPKSGAPAIWIAAGADGPWTKIDHPWLEGLFVDRTTPYLLGTDGLFRVEGLGTAIQPRVARERPILRRRGAAWTMEVPVAWRGQRWSLVGTDGRILGTGQTTAETALPAAKGPAWLRIGNVSIAVPSF